MNNYLVTVTIVVVRSCVIVWGGGGCRGGYLDYTQLPRPSREAQTPPSIMLHFVYGLL